MTFALLCSVLLLAPTNCTVVVRENSTPCERRAAAELCDLLRRQTGADLPVITDAAPLPARAILLGATRHTATLLGDPNPARDLGDEGFRLKAVPPHLLIVGGAGRGPLYGVCELFERFGGCGWYGPGFEVVPNRTAFAVPATLDETQKPAFALRTLNWRVPAAFAARNKLNLTSFDAPLGGSRFRFDDELGMCHTFNRLLPPEKYFDAHPDYFSLVGGHRLRHETQLCLTNPDVLRLCTEKVLARLAATYPKGVRYYGVSPNDWNNACACENCRAATRRAQSPAGPLIAFVNAIAAAVEPRYPEAVIQTLAYGYTRHPPVGVTPRRNVQVWLCTIECDFARPIPESRARANRSTLRDFRGWRALGTRLAVWDYAADYANYHHVWPNFRALQGNLAFYRDQGVEELFALTNGGGLNDVWNNLRCWLLAKTMWNPQADQRALLARAFRDLFGPAASDVQKAFDALQQAPRDTKRFPMGCFTSVYEGGLDPAALARADAALARAEAHARGTAWEATTRLARVPIDFTQALRGAARPGFVPPEPTRWRAERDAARRLMEAMAHPGGLALCDDLAGRTVFTTRLRALAAQEMPPAPASRRLRLEETQLMGDFPATRFTYVDDPAAGDGRALRLPGTAARCTAWLDLRSLALTPGRACTLRVRLRTSRPAATGEIAFRAGVYNCTFNRVVTFCKPEAAEPTTRYRWYALGTFVPQRGDALWIGLGGGDDPNAPAPDVFVDAVTVEQ